jgi:hypothetical protein
MEAAPSLRSRVEAELQVQDGSVSPEAVAALGARVDVAVVLAEIAEDEQAPALARHRAMALIARFPTQRGSDLLERMSRSGATPYTRKTAARALERLTLP